VSITQDGHLGRRNLDNATVEVLGRRDGYSPDDLAQRGLLLVGEVGVDQRRVRAGVCVLHPVHHRVAGHDDQRRRAGLDLATDRLDCGPPVKPRAKMKVAKAMFFASSLTVTPS
jgi:hypothetical protein